MTDVQTFSASEFKAKCLDILDKLASHEIGQVVVTKRGKPVAVLTPPPSVASAVRGVHGFMRGSANLPEGLDLTAPVNDEPFAAELGALNS